MSTGFGRGTPPWKPPPRGSAAGPSRPGRMPGGSGRPSQTGTPIGWSTTGWALSRHRSGEGPSRSRSDSGTVRRKRQMQVVAAESSVRVETDWLKPSQSQDSAARAARGSFSGGSPRCTIPADRPSRAATDGKRRHPGPASPSGAAALPKALAMVRRRRVLKEGRQASALRPHGWKASKAGPRTTRSGSCHGCARGTAWAAFRLRSGSPPRIA